MRSIEVKENFKIGDLVQIKPDARLITINKLNGSIGIVMRSKLDYSVFEEHYAGGYLVYCPVVHRTYELFEHELRKISI